MRLGIIMNLDMARMYLIQISKSISMKNKHKIEVWQGMDGQWYWHISSVKNNKPIVTSEGYVKKSNCKASVKKFMSEIAGKNWESRYPIIELTK